jgi:YD repeat-containing protein
MADLIPGTPASSVPSECPSGTSAARIWTVPGSDSYGSGTATYYLCFTYLNYQTAFDLSSVLPSQVNGSISAVEASQSLFGQALMLTAIVLPDGNSYTFAYDQYLSLTTLGLPSGATITYTWQNVVFYPYPTVNHPTVNSWAGIVTPISRALLQRTVTPGDGQPAITTTYHWYITSNSADSGSANGVQFPAYSVVTDSNGNDTEYTLGGTDDAGNSWGGYVTTAVAWYSGCSPHHAGCSGGGTLTKSQTYVLAAIASGGAQYNSPAFIPQLYTISPTKIIQTTTHLPGTGGTQLSRVTNTIVPGYGTCSVAAYPAYNTSSEPLQYQSYNSCYATSQVQSTATYDFGSPGSGSPGPLLKTDYTTYVWQPSLPSSFPSGLSTYSGNSTYLSADLINLVNQEQTRDGSGNWAKQINFNYDQSPSPSGAKGNLTAISRFVNSGSAVQTQMQFNTNGVVTLSIDPNGNQTQYTSFVCNGALPQTVTEAYGSSTTTPEAMSYGYDCNTGKVTSAKDPNGQTTSFTYADPLNRVTLATYPDGGSTSVNYNGDTLPLTMTVTKQTGGPQGPEITTTSYDGLVRPVQTQQSLSGAGIFVNKNYDNIGRVEGQSNPYYSTSDSTYGWTTWAYDALSRPLYKCNQNNGTPNTGPCTPGSSYQSWSYNGNITTFKNETGNSWQRTADALGRLTQIIEPESLYTQYSYDALDDLTCAVQMGSTSSGFTTCASAQTAWRPRSFSYDGLSRLVQGFDAESGWTCYGTTGGTAPNGSNCTEGYDGNGNLLYETDARGVTTSYAYDALNRVSSKSYSDGQTPTSCYQYDTNSVTGTCSTNGNLVGRLTNAWTQKTGANCPSSAPAAGSFLTLKSILAYDPMGRPQCVQQQQCNGNSAQCSTPVTYSLGMNYDLAGNMTGLTNSVGAALQSLTLNTAFDAASRPCLTYSKTTNGSWNYFPATLFQANPGTGSSAGYIAAGDLQDWYMGASTATPSSGCGQIQSSPINIQQNYTDRLWVNSVTASGQTP